MRYIVNGYTAISRSGKRIRFDALDRQVMSRPLRALKDEILDTFDPWRSDPVIDVKIEYIEL